MSSIQWLPETKTLINVLKLFINKIFGSFFFTRVIFNFFLYFFYIQYTTKINAFIQHGCLKFNISDLSIVIKDIILNNLGGGVYLGFQKKSNLTVFNIDNNKKCLLSSNSFKALVSIRDFFQKFNYSKR